MDNTVDGGTNSQHEEVSTEPLPGFVSPGRSRSGGRPWDFYVCNETQGTRRPTSRQACLLEAIGILDGAPHKLLCNLQRAESILTKYHRERGVSPDELNEAVLNTRVSDSLRASLSLCYATGETCHTMTSGNSNLYWACVPNRRSEFLTPSEVAGFMGQSRRQEYLAARSLVAGDYRLTGMLAESVHGRMAWHCAQVVLSHHPTVATVGSLYSGAFDALATGFIAAGHPLTRLFVAECDEIKMSVLRATYSPEHCFASAGDAAEACPAVDVIVASPPCVEVSRAHRYECELDREEIPAEAVSKHLGCIIGAIRRARPKAFVIEQSYGLRTHHKEAYQRMCQEVNTLGYKIYHSEVDAAEAYLASHHRTRLLWVGY